jgi:chaperonin GroES
MRLTAATLVCLLSAATTAAWVSQPTTLMRRLTTVSRAAEAAETAEAAATTEEEIPTLDGRKINGVVAPLNNFLLISRSDAVEATDGGIFLTGKAKIRKYQGPVVSVGPGRTHPDSGLVFDMPVKVGDGVVYGKFDGVEVDISGTPHTLIRDDDILVTYTPSDGVRAGDQVLTLANVHVLRDNLLIFCDEKLEVETEGGILLAKSSNKSESRPSTGLVQKVGPGKMAADGSLMAMDLAVGDMVKFRDYAVHEVEIDGKDYSVVKMADVLAKF